MPIHQDLSCLDETRHEPLGMWMALSDTNEENGCLNVVRGSHRLPHRLRCYPDFFPWPELVPVVYRDLLTPLPVRAGQGVIFSAHIFHASQPNRSLEPRLATYSQLVPDGSALWYVHATADRSLEIFEVPDDFYLRHRLGTRPNDLAPIRVVPAENPPISIDELLAVCG